MGRACSKGAISPPEGGTSANIPNDLLGGDAAGDGLRIKKHVSHFNGTNRQILRWDEKVINVCPNCNRPDESTTHINRCPDPGRRSIMEESAKELKKWMKSKQMDQELSI